MSETLHNIPDPEISEHHLEQPEETGREDDYIGSEQEKVRAWAKAALEEIYLVGYPDSAFQSDDFLPFSQDIKHVVKYLAEKDPQSGLRIFFEELINFVAVKSDPKNDQEKLRRFLSALHEVTFAGSPNIINHLDLADQLIITAKANRVPEAQGYFGQGLTGEIVYELNWSQEGIENELAKIILKRKPAEILDIIQQLETVGAHAAGEMYDATRALEKVVNIVRQVRTGKSSPIFDYASGLALARLRQESRDPSLGFVTYEGNRQHGRLGRDFSHAQQKQHLKLSGQINPDIAVEGTMLPIASDAVAVFDHSQTPRQIARVSFEQLPEAEPISILAVRNAIETCKDPRRLYPEDLVNLISFINDRIMAHEKKSWTDISDRLSVEDWEEFFRTKQDFEALKQRYNQAFYSGELESYDTRQLWQSQEGHALQEAATKIGSAYPIMRPELVGYLKEVESKLSKKLTSAHFENYNSIPHNRELNPFLGSDDEHTALLLQHLHQPELRQKIEEDLGINLTDIPLRSQIHLLRFLASQNREGFDRMRGVLQSHPENSNRIVQSFLAVAEDMQYGESILGLAEKLDEASLTQILDKYLEIVGSSEQIRPFLMERYAGNAETEELISIVQKNILIRANQLLKRSVESVSQNPGEIENLLERIKQEQGNASMLAATIKSIVERGGSLETIKGLASSEVVGPDLDKGDTEAMEGIYGKNWINKTTPQYWQLLKEKFTDSTKNPKARFRILRDNGKIIAFLRFTEMQDKDKQPYIHFGAFNVDIPYQSGKIGEDFLQSVIDIEKQRGLAIRCETNPSNPMLRKYEAMGFKRVGQVIERGEPEVKLEIPAQFKVAQAA